MPNAREKFTQELDKNFSVQAAAGTGKTTALVNRIAHAAAVRPGILGDFVVVTYTNRAADEMRSRLRERLLGTGTPETQVIQGLSRMFIGTIHGFCLKLIQQHGLALGCLGEVNSITEAATEVHALYNRLRPQTPSSRSSRAALYRLCPERDIQALGRSLSRYTVDWAERLSTSLPNQSLTGLKLDPGLLDSVEGKGAGLSALKKWQSTWRNFAGQWNTGQKFLDWPRYDDKGGAALKQAWPHVLGTLAGPALEAALQAAMEEAADFQEFRFIHGMLYFSDQIILARRLLKHPVIRRRLLEENHRILLDEAQDTDPSQFELLVELARPPGSNPFDWPNPLDSKTVGAPPRPGHWVMVGDQQQAIYRDRATLELYSNYHKALVNSPQGEALSFAETYRCREKIVSWVNAQMASVLNGKNGQADYVRLTAQEKDDPGQVVFWHPPQSEGDTAQKASQESLWIAQELLKIGPSGVRARSWSEVAILCPAREWLVGMQRALLRVGLASVLHFDRGNDQRPEYLWLCALLGLCLEPNNEFEIIGVMRELYGVSDDLIYSRRWKDGPEHPRSFTLAPYPQPADICETLLDQWHQLRQETGKLPLAEAVRRWCDHNGLFARLAALENGQEAVAGLNTLLLECFEAQGQGKSLLEWWLDLREGLSAGSPRPRQEDPGALQLMTIQKSKGLQWDAVILPFLGRKNTSGTDDYPRSLYRPKRSTPVGARSVDDFSLKLAPGVQSPHWEESSGQDQEEAARERRRLYYVAVTRARYSLVLVDDESIWGKTLKEGTWKLGLPNGYEGFRDRPLETHEEFTNPLRSHQSLGSLVATSGEHLPTSPAFVPTSQPPKRYSEGSLFSHAFSHVEPQDSMNPLRSWIEIGSDESLAYGNWWHDWVRRMPWNAGLEAVRAASVAELQSLLAKPWSARASQEIHRLLDSGLSQELARLSPSDILWEVPYLIETKEGNQQERRIDLLLRAGDSSWILLDWKTDQEPTWETLLQKHAAQIDHYRAAANQSGLNIVQARLYSTVLGEWREVA